MNDQAQIPCYPEDRKRFKIVASNRDITMKDLFHEWIVMYSQDGNLK
jgi:hypothetical protein